MKESISTIHLNLYISEKLNRAERYIEKEVFNSAESSTTLKPNGGWFFNSLKNVLKLGQQTAHSSNGDHCNCLDMCFTLPQEEGHFGPVPRYNCPVFRD